MLPRDCFRVLLAASLLALPAGCNSTSSSSGGAGGGSGAPVSATASSANGQILLSWSASSGSPAGYYVENSTNGTTFSQVTSVTGTSVTMSNLSRGTRYFFRVRAYNSGGTSAYSSVVSAVP